MTEDGITGNTRNIAVPKEEVDLLRRTFKGNENLLILIRALLFGFPLSDKEKGLIRGALKEDAKLRKAIQGKIYSELSANAPIGANPDFWVGIERQIIGQHPDTVKQVLDSKSEALKMLKHAMTLLEEPDGAPLSVAIDDSKEDTMGIRLIARNLYIQAVETGLSYIKIIAEMPEDKKLKQSKKDKQDSSR